MLGLLCAMYLITYVDRVNISTAARDIQKELGLSNTQLGFLQSAFGYPYLLFQIFGGWVGDRFGPRRTLFQCGLIEAADHFPHLPLAAEGHRAQAQLGDEHAGVGQLSEFH